jgi:hypothetical protein
MDLNLERSMIKLSNNSPLTVQAAAKLSEAFKNMSDEDENTIRAWFKHAEREQQHKISAAERKFKFR